MRPFKSLSPRAAGIIAALVTVVIWTSFIVIARATADPARGGALNPFDIAHARLLAAERATVSSISFTMVFGVRTASVAIFKPVAVALPVLRSVC